MLMITQFVKSEGNIWLQLGLLPRPSPFASHPSSGTPLTVSRALTTSIGNAATHHATAAGIAAVATSSSPAAPLDLASPTPPSGAPSNVSTIAIISPTNAAAITTTTVQPQTPRSAAMISRREELVALLVANR
jgi:hypothetical protein